MPCDKSHKISHSQKTNTIQSAVTDHFQKLSESLELVVILHNFCKSFPPSVIFHQLTKFQYDRVLTLEDTQQKQFLFHT